MRSYLRFGLSYRDVEELLAERGIAPVFHQVVAFNGLATNAATTLAKGTTVTVTGEFVDDSWQPKEDRKIWRHKLRWSTTSPSACGSRPPCSPRSAASKQPSRPTFPSQSPWADPPSAGTGAPSPGTGAPPPPPPVGTTRPLIDKEHKHAQAMSCRKIRYSSRTATTDDHARRSLSSDAPRHCSG